MGKIDKIDFMQKPPFDTALADVLSGEDAAGSNYGKCLMIKWIRKNFPNDKKMPKEKGKYDANRNR